MRSIRAKLITLLLCCVILSSATIGVICVGQTSSLIHETAKDNMVLLCDKTARSINTVLDNIETSVDTLAHYITENLPSTDILYDTESREHQDFFTKIDQVGTNHASSFQHVVSVYAVFDPVAYGAMGFCYEANSSGELVAAPLPTPSAPVTGEEDWWHTPVTSGRSVWINKEQTDETRLFSYVVPIFYQGDLLCVIGMDFSYSFLHEAISSIRLKETGFGTVLDREGRIIAHPSLAEDAVVAEQNSDFHAIFEQFKSIQQASFEMEEYNLDKALSRTLLPYEAGGEQRMLTMCVLRNGMILCLSAPTAELFAEQRVMMGVTLIGMLIVSLLAVIIALIVATHLSNPIVTLEKAAKQFTEGDLDTPVLPTTKDEIGRLARSLETTRVRMKAYIDDLYREAHIDGLTGTQNKAAFAIEEKALNERIKAQDAAFCMAVYDVNYLKITNDIFGHMAGDELLQKVSNCIKSSFGPQNVFRLGGDEFVAICYTEDPEEGLALSAQCVAKIEQEKLELYPDVPVSCAMGVSAFRPESDQTVADVIARADMMMYKQKTETKKSTPFWHKDLKSIREAQIGQYLQFLRLLSESVDAYLFLLDITEDRSWFFGNVREKFDLGTEGAPTNTTAEMLEIVHPADREALITDLKRISDGTSDTHNMNYRWINREGMPVWINCHGKVINNAEGKPFLMIGRVSDTALRPWYTPLTGLFNKAKLSADIRNQKTPPFQRFVLINIDNLSHINLKRGREHGDQALLLLASILTQNFPGNTIYHLEKDHFALLLDTQDEDEILRHIQTIRDALENEISISVAVVPNEKQYYVDADSIYEYARHLLKSNKRKGSGTISFFTKEDFAKTLSNIELIEEMEASIANHCEGFYLCYQPQVDARTHQVVSAETLLRYCSKEKGQLFPDVFIPLLERTQLIREVGMWVLDNAVAQCERWRRQRPDMRISVNVSSVQLQDADLASRVLEVLKKHGLPASALTLELTESVELTNTDYAQNFAKLRKAGVHIAIDDFGTGYANLGYLKKIQADELKIDRMFIKDIKQGSFHHTLINNVVSFAKDNALSVCMEGVETTEELAVLELTDPHLLQGYLFNKPLLAEDFEAKYVASDAPLTWPFENDLKKQRDRARFAYFDTKDILSNIQTGLWMLHYNPVTHHGRLYADETMRTAIDADAPLQPDELYRYFMEHLPPEELSRVQEMFLAMTESTGIVQLEFNWIHPARGKTLMRCTGKCTGKNGDLVMYEGFLRNLDDQTELQDQ